MVDTAAEVLRQDFDKGKISVEERVLTEVNNLNTNRLGNVFSDNALRDVYQNLYTAIQEASMPYAVTETRHEYHEDNETGNKTFMWLGKTAVQNAMSGYRFHNHPEAIKRVDIEVDEAKSFTDNMDIGLAKVFISPRMTRVDASFSEACSEHLAEDDSIRVSYLEADKEGSIRNRVMNSLLVKDIPYEAWISMLRDPSNIFGKSIELSSTGSALDIMKVHRQLEVPVEKVPNGPVDILDAVIPYINDYELRERLQKEAKKYYQDQEKMAEIAKIKAQEWLEFEMELANSLYSNRASFEIERFINSLQEHWGEEDLVVIKGCCDPRGGYFVSKELAIAIEKAKQNLLWSGTAAQVNNREVYKQVDQTILTRIIQNEELIAVARLNGMEYRTLEAQNNRLIASLNLKVGSGCSGKSEAKFKTYDDGNLSNLESEKSNDDKDSKENWKWKQGVCRVKSCGKKTEVGPCDVCRNCQAKFDKGEDPTKALMIDEIKNTPNSEIDVSFMGIMKAKFESQIEVLEGVK
ncbi:MAG: hypothetical protein U0451_03810 [Candidatus Saccharimonadales bacterium]